MGLRGELLCCKGRGYLRLCFSLFAFSTHLLCRFLAKRKGERSISFLWRREAMRTHVLSGYESANCSEASVFY